MSKRFRLQPFKFKLPALRFRGKIMLGFMVVLAISAISMGIAYLGFERVSASVATYRESVAEVNLARNIDHGVILYRGLAQYYVVTGKEDDAKAALAAEAGLKEAIERAMKDTTNPAGLDQVTRLSREFRIFTKIFADIVKVKGDSAFVAQNELERGGNMLRYKLDEISGNAGEAQLPAVELGVKQVIGQFQATTALANMFVVNSDQTEATGALARLKFVENAMNAISADNDEIVSGLKEAHGSLDGYRKALNKLVDNAKSIRELTGEMSDSATAIEQGSSAMKAALIADQQRIEAEANAAIKGTERLIAMLAAGGFVLGAILAMLLGRGISRPMIVMCKAMRELAGGNFAVVLPGLGRSDEIGEMASAVEEFKVQAVAKAERDAAEQDARNQAASAARRTELIRFADEFESAVGSIVSNVSASAGQLETAAGTLTRTAETTQNLSSKVAGSSEEASSNMQAVASATEELSASVNEIGKRVRELSQDRGGCRRSGAADRRAHRQIVPCGARDRRRCQADHGDRRTDQSARAQRHYRGCPRRRGRPGVCGRRLRGQVAGKPDRKGNRRYLLSYRRHAGCDAGIGRSHQGDRRYDFPDLRDRDLDCASGRASELRHAGDRAQRAECCARHRRGGVRRHGSQSRRYRNRFSLRRCVAFGPNAGEREHEAAE